MQSKYTDGGQIKGKKSGSPRVLVLGHDEPPEQLQCILTSEVSGTVHEVINPILLKDILYVDGSGEHCLTAKSSIEVQLS